MIHHVASDSILPSLPAATSPGGDGLAHETIPWGGGRGESTARGCRRSSGRRVTVHTPEEGGNRATGVPPLLPFPSSQHLGAALPQTTLTPLPAGCFAGRNCSTEAAAQNSEVGRTSGGLRPSSCSEQGWLQGSSGSLRASPCPSENQPLSQDCTTLLWKFFLKSSQCFPHHYPWSPVLPSATSLAPS